MAVLLDPLFCPEEPFIEEDDHFSEPAMNESCNLFDSTELLSSLLAKAPAFELADGSLDDHPYLHSARNDAVQWIKSASARFGFTALTAILAVNYLDRCFLCSDGLRLHQDKPWMKQLSAVACLALAAKVEETHVPFLLDLQIPPAAEEVSGFVFESKTIRRMELLVLSTLGWRMNPVTALAFVQCVLPKLKNHNRNNAVEIVRSCESILLAVLSDWRWVQFSPSVWAAAAMQQALGRHCDEMPRILELLQVSKERVESCSELIVELRGVNNSTTTTTNNNNNKRRCCCYDPPSPTGVIGSCFSYESSSSLDSWTAWPSSSVSSSPEPPPFKKPNCSII